MAKIVISTTTFGEFDHSPLNLLKSAGHEVILNPHSRKLASEEVVTLAQDAVGLIAGTEELNEQVLTKMPKLKIISRCGVGVDNINMKVAERLGIKVVNTPDAPTQAVAELTIALILNLLRKVNAMDAAMRKGAWKKEMGFLLMHKKVGIVGLGRVGKKVAELLKPFSVEIAYHDVKPNSAHYRFESLPELLAHSDIVTLHCPSQDDKKYLLDKKAIQSMKKESYLINTSRGGLVDEQALYEALKTGQVNGAALDVFENEPYKGKLLELENVLVTPHIGSYARESRIAMELEAAERLIEGLK